MEILSYTYNSKDTALIVQGYRHTIRYWIQHRPKLGFCFMQQTADPNRLDTWTKPKISPYYKVAMVMYRNDNGQLKYAGLDIDASYGEAMNFKNLYCDGVSDIGQTLLNKFIERKKEEQR